MEWRVSYEMPAIVGVRGAIRIISDVCRPLGLCPMSYSPIVKVSRVFTMYTYCVLLPLYNTVYVISMYQSFAQAKGNPYKFVGRLSSFLLYIILTNVALLTAPSRIRGWIKYLQTMENIILRETISDLKERIWAYASIIFLVLSILNTDSIILYMCLKFHNCTSVSMWLPAIMLTIMTCMLQCTSYQFIFLVVRIHTATVAVNTSLRKLLRDKSDPTYSERRYILRNTCLICARPKTPHYNGVPGFRSTGVYIRQLAHDYMAMCKIISQVSKQEQMVTTLFIIAVMSRLMLSVYSAAKSKIPEFLSFAMMMYIMEIYWGVYMAFIVTLILEPCERTYEQLNETRELLDQLKKEYNSDVELVNELDHFLKTATLMNPKFTPFQIITLNRSLLAQILGGVATYVVTFTQIVV